MGSPIGGEEGAAAAAGAGGIAGVAGEKGKGAGRQTGYESACQNHFS